MPRGKITQENVNAEKAGDNDSFLWDDKLAGFGLKVTPKGAKIYVYQYRMGGRGSPVQRYTIGPEGTWRAASARREAERLAILVGQGVNVVKQRKAVAIREAEAKEMAFTKYLEDFATTKLKAQWPRSWKATHARLKLHAGAAFKTKPLPDITKDDVRRLMAKLGGKGALARNVWASLSFLFNEAVKADDIAVSPLLGLDAPKAGDAREHFLNHDELRWLWLSTLDANKPYGAIVRLLILLGQRRNEVSDLPWAELDRKAGTWTLPPERSKNGEASIIPLPSAAIAELDAIAGEEKWPRKGFVFPSREGTPVSGFSKMKRRLDAAMSKLAAKEGGEVRPWVLHDLRRTLATNLQSLGVDFAVTEHLLNHKEKTRTGIAKVYQRHGYLAEKRAALDLWQGRLEGIVSGSGVVVPFGKLG